MVLGSIFSFLNPLTRNGRESSTSFNRDVFGVPKNVQDRLKEVEGPRGLIARADLRAVNKQRQQLATNFGFEDTISNSGFERDIQLAPKGKKKGKNKRTLLGN